MPQPFFFKPGHNTLVSFFPSPCCPYVQVTGEAEYQPVSWTVGNIAVLAEVESQANAHTHTKQALTTVQKYN